MLTAHQIPHRIKKKLAPGIYNVSHPDACLCFMVMSPPHARFITYSMAYGQITCNHCRITETLPCPGKRVSFASKDVYMDLGAIQDDLLRFTGRHESCPEVVAQMTQPQAELP